MKKLALIFVLLLTACGTATPSSYPIETPRHALPGNNTPYPAAPTSPALQMPVPYPKPSGELPMPTTNPENDIFRPLRPARDFLAQQLDLPPQEIQVATYEQANFPDGCLGLPHPGEMCIQVITPGYVVTFHTPKGDFIFHIAKSGNPFRMLGGGQSIEDK